MTAYLRQQNSVRADWNRLKGKFVPRGSRPDKDFAGLVYDPARNKYALVVRRGGEVKVTHVGEKGPLKEVARTMGFRNIDEIKFGTRHKDQISGGKMVVEGMRAIQDHEARAQRRAQEDSARAEMSPEAKAMREKIASQVEGYVPEANMPDPEQVRRQNRVANAEGAVAEAEARLEAARRDAAMARIEASGRPTEELRSWTTAQIEEYEATLRATARAAEVPKADLEPNRGQLNSDLEAAVMDHVWGDEGPDIDPPEAIASAAPDPGPHPMPGGTGEAMEPYPDEHLEIVADDDLRPPMPPPDWDPQARAEAEYYATPGMAHHSAEPVLDADVPVARVSANSTPLADGLNVPGPEANEARAYVQYGEQLKAWAASPNCPNPEAAEAAAKVMQAFPTANAASAKIPSRAASASKEAVAEKKLVKRLKK